MSGIDKYTDYSIKHNITRQQAIDILCADCDGEECKHDKEDKSSKKTKELKLDKETK